MTAPGTDRQQPDEADATGGEAACALHRVCDACGALEDGPPAPVCARCTAPAGRARRPSASAVPAPGVPARL